MARCRVDQSLKRIDLHGFQFPLGVYPVEDVEPKAAYTVAFEPADGDADPLSAGYSSETDEDDLPDGGTLPRSGKPGSRSGDPDSGDAPLPMNTGEWEEWPDRYVYDILVPSPRVEPLLRSLLAIVPGRIYPILDFLGQDEWREVDPYVSYDLLGLDRFMDALQRYKGFFFEDGLIGFGVMSEEPFIYVFVDEHKVVTVRVQADLKDKIEVILAAFDLEQTEALLSADSVTHEHRSVLDAPDERRDLLTPEEIVEDLRDQWRLVLNVDPESNVDEEGNDLGTTGWRCIMRYDPPIANPAASGASATQSASTTATSAPTPAAANEKTTAPVVPEPRYCQIFLTAENLSRAAELAVEALEQLLSREGQSLEPPPESSPALESLDELPLEPMLVQADRWGQKDFEREVEAATGQKPEMDQSQICFAEWLQ
jgi:hypothetical protein